ncbi:hypothetical protein BDZ91DRAFT_785090 [Kalaharituber pfeilii]|nr:hypothetical protein BDZ91DRAFT_785090 [Kalaharituber pfeilii]
MLLPKIGVVIAAGRCAKTVKVRVAKTVQDPHIGKYITRHDEFLAHDEREVCIEGDVVQVSPGHRASSTKRHIVTRIVSAERTGNPRLRPESQSEYLKRRETEFTVKQFCKLIYNPHKYFKKYEKVLPDVVAQMREELEEKERLEREQALKEEMEAKIQMEAKAIAKKEKEERFERYRLENEAKAAEKAKGNTTV